MAFYWSLSSPLVLAFFLGFIHLWPCTAAADTRKIILHTLPVVLTVVFLIIAYCFCRCVCRKTRAREGTDKDEAKFRRKRKDIADKHKEREKERQERYDQIKKKYIKRGTEAV